MNSCAECQKYKQVLINVMKEQTIPHQHGKISMKDENTVIYITGGQTLELDIDNFTWVVTHGLLMKWYYVYGDKYLDPAWHEYYNYCKQGERDQFTELLGMSPKTTTLKIMEHGPKFQRGVYLPLEESLRQHPPPHPSYE